jgi:26S proteasome regulatory subunit T5
MNVHPDVNFEELARSTDDFNGAQLKAVCVEAGMLALRRDATEVLSHAYPVSLSNLRTLVLASESLTCQHNNKKLNSSASFLSNDSIGYRLNLVSQ